MIPGEGDAAPPHPGPAETRFSEPGRLEEESRSFGVAPAVLSQATRDPGIREALEGLPAAVREAYRNLSGQDKLDIAERLQGTSGFLFFRVENRQAFIDGTVAGVDVFDQLQATLAEQVEGGKLDREVFDRLSRTLQALRRLTPRDRAALLSLLEADVAWLRASLARR